MIETGEVQVEEFVALYTQFAFWDINAPTPARGNPNMGHFVESDGSLFCVYALFASYPHIGVARWNSCKKAPAVEIVDAWLVNTIDESGVMADQYVQLRARKYRPLLSSAILSQGRQVFHTPVVSGLASEALPAGPDMARTRFNFLSSAVQLLFADTNWPPEPPRPGRRSGINQ